MRHSNKKAARQLTLPFESANLVNTVLQVRKMNDGVSYFVSNAFKRINEGNLDNCKIRFGGGEVHTFSDLIFDLSNPKDCYGFAKLVCERDNRTLDTYRASFNIPRFIITPDPSKCFIKGQGINKSADVIFRACLAKGERGNKVIIPILKNWQGRKFEKFKKQGQKIIAVHDVQLCSGDEANLFNLIFREDIAHMTAYNSTFSNRQNTYGACVL